jgi:hypothetical protein
MIDTSIVRVQQRGASIADNSLQDMGRSRGGLTSKIHTVVDPNGLPVHLALTLALFGSPQRDAPPNDVTRGSWIRRGLDQGACTSARSVGEYSAETKSRRPDLLQPVSVSRARQPMARFGKTLQYYIFLLDGLRANCTISGAPAANWASTARLASMSSFASSGYLITTLLLREEQTTAQQLSTRHCSELHVSVAEPVAKCLTFGMFANQALPDLNHSRQILFLKLALQTSLFSSLVQPLSVLSSHPTELTGN